MTTCPHCGQFNETGREICSGCGMVLTTPGGWLFRQTPEPIPIPDVRVGDFFKIGWEIFKDIPAGLSAIFSS